MAINEFKKKASELKSRRVPELEVGYAVIYHVIANKLRNERLYKKSSSDGIKKRFQNFESNSVLRALERLVEDEEPLYSQEAREHILELKQERVDFYHINFIYDGIMFLSIEKNIPLEELGQSFGEKTYNLSSRLPPGKSPYEIFLNSIIKGIYEDYNINLK